MESYKEVEESLKSLEKSLEKRLEKLRNEGEITKRDALGLASDLLSLTKNLGKIFFTKKEKLSGMEQKISDFIKDYKDDEDNKK